jgi:replicative DNA helicase
MPPNHIDDEEFILNAMRSNDDWARAIRDHSEIVASDFFRESHREEFEQLVSITGELPDSCYEPRGEEYLRVVLAIGRVRSAAIARRLSQAGNMLARLSFEYQSTDDIPSIFLRARQITNELQRFLNGWGW